MTSSRPYLIRAIHQWIVDNGLTPYVLVNTAAENVTVPTQHIEDNKIILNLSPYAVRELEMTNEKIQCSARFGGVPMVLHFPPRAVLAIYARENGQGMIFDRDGDDGGDPEPDPPKPGKPNLRVVK